MIYNSLRLPGRKSQMTLPASQTGIGLIEILIAVLVLGIGILGVASTQVVSMQMNSQSQNRSQAVLLAEDLFDRIRANPANPAGYALAAGAAQGGNNGDCATGFVPGNGNVTDDDIASWQNSLTCLLPAAQRTVAVNGNVVTITIDWDQNDANATPVVVRTQI
ncbi:type IV pilus modification protein PilV [Marinobacter apostichopi]|uniref:type IV pilus modification protein PilV n=1 Tax=Marinobacter apostichopi TaxID=3035454 RepID=UPI0025724696|nr:type IV pilus modification protein PilV [Marinobacter sp. LA51]